MYCVIVGDMVASKGKDARAREAIFSAAKLTFALINMNHRESILAPFGLVRGDAFEGVLTDPTFALPIARQLIRSFYAVDRTCFRIAIALGELTTVSEDRNEADGPAFHEAFAQIEALKRKKSEHWLQLAVSTGAEAQPLVDGLLAMLGALTQDWTDRQRQVCWVMDEGAGSPAPVAERLNIPLSSVYKHLRVAHYPAWRQAWDGLEDYLAAQKRLEAKIHVHPTDP